MIVIVDYGLGNLGSIAKMLKKIGAEAKVTSDPRELKQARKLVLPGVGAFNHGMSRLRETGLQEALNECIIGNGIPILGICLGMQLMTRRSEEGSLPGLGWVKADTRRFRFAESEPALKVPHMGWNEATPREGSTWFAGIEKANRFYFVHSYHVVCDRPEEVLSVTRYGYDFASAFECDNIVGVQFHPEKSHRFGMALLKNFVEI